MADEMLAEIRDLLREVRDLLIPVEVVHHEEYERLISERQASVREAVRELLSTEKRRKAWDLADGTRTQRDIARQAGMDEGGASKFFKALRELEAVAGSPNPKRTMEVT